MESLKAQVPSVFAGSIDSVDATHLACTLVEAFNEETGGINNDGHAFPGFINYAEHLGLHDNDAQLASSTIFKPGFMKKNEWPELHKVFNEVSSIVGPSFEPRLQGLERNGQRDESACAQLAFRVRLCGRAERVQRGHDEASARGGREDGAETLVLQR